MKEKSIRLHPEHGVNPTLPVCFLCGKDTGEIYLLGAAYKGKAPMHMTNEKTYCTSCKGHLDEGATALMCHTCRSLIMISAKAATRLPFERLGPVMYVEAGIIPWLMGEENSPCSCAIPEELRKKSRGVPAPKDGSLET